MLHTMNIANLFPTSVLSLVTSCYGCTFFFILYYMLNIKCYTFSCAIYHNFISYIHIFVLYICVCINMCDGFHNQGFTGES